MFDALLICVLCSFVALRINRSVNVKNEHTRNIEKKKQGKKIQLENTILVSWIFLETIFTILATLRNFSYNYLVNPQTLNDVDFHFSSAD